MASLCLQQCASQLSEMRIDFGPLRRSKASFPIKFLSSELATRTLSRGSGALKREIKVLSMLRLEIAQFLTFGDVVRLAASNWELNWSYEDSHLWQQLYDSDNERLRRSGLEAISGRRSGSTLSLCPSSLETSGNAGSSPLRREEEGSEESEDAIEEAIRSVSLPSIKNTISLPPVSQYKLLVINEFLLLELERWRLLRERIVLLRDMHAFRQEVQDLVRLDVANSAPSLRVLLNSRPDKSRELQQLEGYQKPLQLEAFRRTYYALAVCRARFARTN